MYDSTPAKKGRRFAVPFLAAIALFIASPVFAAGTISCSTPVNPGDQTTCDVHIDGASFDFERLRIDCTGAVIGGAVGDGSGNVTLTSTDLPSTPGTYVVFGEAPGSGQCTTTGASVTVAAPPPPPPPPVGAGASTMMQTISDGATGFFWTNAVGVFLTGIAGGIFVGLVGWLIGRLMRRRLMR